MSGITEVIHLIADAISLKIQQSLSQQIEAAKHGRATPQPTGLFGRAVQWITGVPASQSLGERLGYPSSATLKRLSESRSAFTQASTAYREIQEKHAAAQSELDVANASPNGQRQSILEASLKNFTAELDQATKAAKAAETEYLRARSGANPNAVLVSALKRQHDAAVDAMGHAKDRRDIATSDLELDRASSGLDLSKLREDVDALSKSMVAASEKTQKAATVHEESRKEASRSVQWQELARFRVQQTSSDLSAAMNAHASATEAHGKAAQELAEEQANPTGKDLVSLADAVAKFDDALKKSTQDLEAARKAHKQSKWKADRETKWHEERDRTTKRYSLRHPIQSFKNLLRAQRVHSERLRRTSKMKMNDAAARTARESSVARRQLARAQKSHQATRRAFKAAPTWANRLKTVRSGFAVGGARVRMAAVAAKGLGQLGIIRAGAAAGSVFGPVGTAVGAMVGAVASIIAGTKAFVDRQLAKAEAAIQQRIAPKGQYSSMVANAVLRYEAQQRQLDIKNAGATQNTASAVVQSTMRLKEARSEMSNRLENISNRVLVLMNDMATSMTGMLNVLSNVIAPCVEALVGVLEWANPIKKIADAGNKADSPSIGFFKGAEKRNRENINRGDLPQIPDVKRAR